jgi:hypothetical protein
MILRPIAAIAAAATLALTGCTAVNDPAPAPQETVDPCLLDVECNPWLDAPYADYLPTPPVETVAPAPVATPTAAPTKAAPKPVVKPKPKATTKPSPKPTALPPCANEDGPGPCFWDAGTMGNGHGDSFTIDANGVIHYR